MCYAVVSYVGGVYESVVAGVSSVYEASGSSDGSGCSGEYVGCK